MQGAGALASAFGGGGSPKVDYRGAKRGIRWRVRDAKAAGIHPLYAIGAPGVGSGILTPQSSGSDIGGALQGMGQAAEKYFGAPSKADMERQKESHHWKDTQDNMQRGIQTEIMNTEKNLIQMQLEDAQAAREAQRLGHTEKQEIPFAMVPARDPYDGSVHLVPNHQLGIESPEFYGAYKLFEPGEFGKRTNPDSWHPDVLRGYR